MSDFTLGQRVNFTEKLVRVRIHTRRLRKCIAEGSHTDHCQRCGLDG